MDVTNRLANVDQPAHAIRSDHEIDGMHCGFFHKLQHGPIDLRPLRLHPVEHEGE